MEIPLVAGMVSAYFENKPNFMSRQQLAVTKAAHRLPYNLQERKMRLALQLVLVFAWIPLAQADDSDFRVYTEEYPPYNYMEDNQVKGTTTEIVRDILKELDMGPVASNIQLVPWARAYFETRNRKNTAIYTIARTQEREDLFQWVGPVACAKVGIIARKQDHVRLNSLEDISRFNVGVVREDVGHQLLRKMVPGLEMSVTSSSEGNLRMLKEHRIDLFVYDLTVVDDMLHRIDLAPENYESIYVLKEIPFYIAFNPYTNKEFISKFRKAFEKVATVRKLKACN